jgi:hypothetical protein
MRARTLFFLAALFGCVFCALVFTAGYLWYDHDATAGELQFQRGQLDSYGLPDVTDDRCAADTHLLLLRVVPASILGAWFVGTWILFGREALRPTVIRSYFSAPK